MTIGRLQQTINQYRQQLLNHEGSAERALNIAYQHALSVITPELNKLYTEITDKLNAGEPIPPSWIYERLRLESLTLLITQQVDHFGALSLQQTRMLQHLGVLAGQQSALAQLDAGVPTGVRWSFGVPDTKAIANLVGATQAGSPLADLFNGFGSEAAKNVGNALVTGLSLGHNPRVVARDVQQALGVSRARALTISRTELNRAYRGASLETFRANSDVVSGYVWVAALDHRCCAACIAMNGTELSLDQDVNGHPNCRCSRAPKTRDWSDILGPLGIDTSNIPDTRPQIQSGSDWFDEQSEETQRAILGNAKYQAFSDGAFQLSDVIGHNNDPDWGHSIYEKPLKALMN